MSQPKKATSKWIPLSSVQRLDAIGKIARTCDGQQGIVIEFIGRSVILQAWWGRKVTASVIDCTVQVSQREI